MTRRPETSEYAPYYATYVDKVPDGDVLEFLQRSHRASLAWLEGQMGERETYRYGEGKWSIREVVGHLIDTERVFAFRALHFARGDRAPLPGMDENAWAAACNAHGRPLRELVDEWCSVRASTIALFASFDEETLGRQGVASGCLFTVRALGYIVAGHECHHRGVLESRYA